MKQMAFMGYGGFKGFGKGKAREREWRGGLADRGGWPGGRQKESVVWFFT